MKSSLIGALVALLLVASIAPAAELPPLRLDDLYRSPSLFGTEPSAPAWSPDSRYFAFTWNNKGQPQRSLWLASGDGSDLQPLEAPQAGSASVGEFVWGTDSETIFSLRADELWASSLNGGSTALGSLGTGAANLSLAPDGSRLAYLRNGDLWLFDLQKRTTKRLTTIGIPALSSLPLGRYRRPEREIGPGIWGGPSYAWSPDGKSIVVHHVDRRGMRKVPFPNYLADETEPNEIRRGYPGDPNEARRVGVLNVDNSELTFLDLPTPSAHQIVGFSWSKDNVLLLDVASDTAEDRSLYRVERATAQPNLIWQSHRPSRIYTSFAARWLPDGQHVVFLSDLGDRYGLYSIDTTAGQGEPVLLTNPAFDVLNAPQVLGSTDVLFYAANGPSSRERQVYRLSLKGGDAGTPQQITTMPGQNSGYPSPDGRHLAVLHSNDRSPPELYALDTSDGSAQRVTHSPLPEFKQRRWAKARYVSFPSTIDDYSLHARILEPEELKPGHRYPVLFGPMYSNTVRDRWSGIYGRMQQLMVAKGYIVVQVDMRGSTGYGRAFREEFLVDFAGDDIEDISSTVEYLKTLPYIDTQRMGIWGSSYGGTLSVYTLLKKPGLFRAGVAAAAAVDPQFFGTDDVAIVRRPDTHPEVFLNTAERYAANLEDHLLIIHGMQDQVVPFKTTAALADVLIRNGKDFDFAFGPGATHAWSRENHYSRYLFGKLMQHFDRYVMPESTNGGM